jgi:hypothetical protein
MTVSIRTQQWLAKQALKRHEERKAAEQAAKAEAEAYHAEYLNRWRSAEFLGISVHQFKRLVASGRGPACVKNGETRQATVRWRLGELQAFKADPAAYAARGRAEGT